MTAVVADVRSEGDVLVDLNATFTRICISLEEVGGTLRIGGDRCSNQRDPTAQSAISVIPPRSGVHGKANGLTFVRQLPLQVDKPSLVEALAPSIDVESALAPRTMVSNSRIWLLSRIIAAECGGARTTNRAYGDGITLAILSALAEDTEAHDERTETQGGLAPWRLARVTQHPLENLSEPLELEDQAAIVGLSKSHYCRAFKTSMGTSPHQWLLSARIEKAKQLLLAEELPLAEIALAVGFTDQAHFTHTFSKLEGVNPRSWQRAREMPPDPTSKRRPALEVLPGSLRQDWIGPGAERTRPLPTLP